MSSRKPDDASHSLAEIELAERNLAKAIIAEMVRLFEETCRTFPTKLHVSGAFYLAHLYHARENESEYLSAWPIIKGHSGPEVAQFQQLLDELVSEGQLETRIAEAGPFREVVYSSKSDRTQAPISDHAIASIRLAVKEAHDKSGQALSSCLRQRSHSWKQGELGRELVIYVDLLPEDQFQALTAHASANVNLLRSAVTPAN